MNQASAMEYGACSGKQALFAERSPFQRGMVFLQGQRSTLNLHGILLALFAPWLLFLGTYAILAFRIHYGQPQICYLLVGVCFVFGAALPGFFAAGGMKRKFTDANYQPTWYLFLAVACLAAFIAGAVAGEYNYAHFMQPYYDYLNLAVYTGLDTNQYVGQQLMDAGRVNFEKSTELDLGHSMGFRNTDMYCVAPIITKDSPYMAATNYDFWAVGKNCCSGTTADFHCQGFSDPDAKGGLRLVNSADRPFYRLAVQQAEATYKFTATHPLFFTWVHNADDEMYSYAKSGYITFLMWICAYLLFQSFITGAATLAFSKLVHQ